MDEKKTREEYCLTCNKAFTSKAYLQRHIQVIHKKLNQIPNEDRKCRSRKRPLGGSKRPIESINAKVGFHSKLSLRLSFKAQIYLY